MDQFSYKNTIDANHNTFYDGFQNTNEQLHPKHPVDVLQRQAKKNRDELNFDVLKQSQGLHAPLRLMMERKLCQDVGRLPFLQSSNLMLDVLEGTEDDLSYDDFFRDPMEQEHFVTPNLVMDRRINQI